MMTPNQLKLYNQLVLEEGKKSKPYKDTVGKITIGIGRNLTDVGLSNDEIQMLWVNDIIAVENALDRNLPWWRSLSIVRQRVMIILCFNMGITTLLTFKNTLALIQKGDYKGAAAGMLKSKWATQVGKRADRLAKMMETDDEPTDIG